MVSRLTIDNNPWTNVYGLARTLLATSTMITLLFHNVDFLFRPEGKRAIETTDHWPIELSLFSLVPEQHLFLAKWLAILVLILVAIGWRPRITGVLHWYVSFSLGTSCLILDGGDQVTTILTLLLLPVTLTDERKWHWMKSEQPKSNLRSQVVGLIASSCLIIIRLQVAVIYFWAGTGKFAVTEWTNGTALYYWLTHPLFGLAEGLKPIFMPFLTNAFLVTFLTWSVMTLEVVLFMGLVMPKKWWSLLLKTGLIFHFAIIIVHGLVSFFFAMAAALVLYLRPIEQEFEFVPWLRKVVGILRGKNQIDVFKPEAPAAPRHWSGQ